MHTGLLVEGCTALEVFDDVPDEEYDPVLLWSVDLRCEGKRVPGGTEEARKWLLDHEPTIKEAFQTLSEELKVGMDYNDLPLLWNVPKPPRGVRARIACHAMYRADALEMRKVIADISEHWRELIEKLPLPVGV
jgi:hypothetical protein